MKTLVFIRLQQIKFLLKHSRLNQKLRLLAIAILFLLSLVLTCTKNPFIYLLFPTVFIIAIQHNRKDFLLLKKTGLFVHTTIFIEYLVLTFPFLLAGVILGHIMSILIFIVFLLVLPYVYPILNSDYNQKN